MRLQGKVALVTGGSQGIGRAVAAAYAREGATVIVTARHIERLEAAAAKIRKGGGDVVPLRADVADRQQVQQLAGEIKRRFDGLHVLVNNASLLGPRVPILEYPEEDWEAVVAVNLHGPFFVIKACLPLMIPTGGGSIINVSSGVGRIGKPRWGAYAASKFALEGFTQVLAAELLPFHIRVNAVNPGGTRTGMRAAAYPEEDPLTLPTPEQITPVFVYLASDESRDVTGKSLEARDFMGR
ncbi:MAG: SDR family NAD(P)-dependent oxidoreductase [Candidatus Methylomirabilales bacterium]